MNKKTKQFVCLLLCIIMTLSMTSVAEAAPKVTMSKASATVYVGDSVSLKLNNAKGKTTWTSSKKGVATVTNKGKVLAKKAGTTVITAKNGKKKYTCKVTVKNVSVNKNAVNLMVGQSCTLKMNGSSIKSVFSRNTEVATIIRNGKVTAKKAGTTVVTIKAKNDKSYTCKVTVKNATITLNTGNKTIEAGKIFTAKAYGAVSKVNWTSSNTAVATIDANGKIISKKAGSTTIKATANGGSKSFILTVKAKPVTPGPSNPPVITYREEFVSAATCTTEGLTLLHKLEDNKIVETKTITAKKLGHDKTGDFKVIKDWNHDHEAKSMDDVGVVQKACKREGCSHVFNLAEVSDMSYKTMMDTFGKEVTQLSVFPMEVQKYNGKIQIEEAYAVVNTEKASDFFTKINEERVVSDAGARAYQTYLQGEFYAILRSVECAFYPDGMRPNGEYPNWNSVAGEYVQAETMTSDVRDAQSAINKFKDIPFYWEVLMDKELNSMAVGVTDTFVLEEGELISVGSHWVQIMSKKAYA